MHFTMSLHGGVQSTWAFDSLWQMECSPRMN